jgi:hypothetical protein
VDSCLAPPLRVWRDRFNHHPQLPMKRLLLVLSLALFATARLSAAAVSAEELKRANDHLKKTSEAFQKSVAGLSEAQLNFKESPDRWSVAQCAEHIASAEDFLMNMIGDVMKAPARTEPANLKEIDDFVVTAIADRTNKVKAPEPLAPSNRFKDAKGSVDHFKASRAKTIAFLNETKDLRDHAADSPLGKKLDAYQWVLFISAHTERHTKQIEQVKADPNFPKK